MNRDHRDGESIRAKLCWPFLPLKANSIDIILYMIQWFSICNLIYIYLFISISIIDVSMVCAIAAPLFIKEAEFPPSENHHLDLRAVRPGCDSHLF